MARSDISRVKLASLSVLVVLVWAATTAEADFSFGGPANLGAPVNSFFHDAVGGISADGLSLFLDSDRPGGSGGVDIWVTVRETVGDDWCVPTNLGPAVNSAAGDEQDSLEANNGGLYIGCGADQSPDSFFTGLIDDVRIYNRAVHP